MRLLNANCAYGECLHRIVFLRIYFHFAGVAGIGVGRGASRPFQIRSAAFWMVRAFILLNQKLSRHRNTDDIAPLADALVGLEVDGFVFQNTVDVLRRLKELLQPSDETMQRLMEVLQ